MKNVPYLRILINCKKADAGEGGGGGGGGGGGDTNKNET